jgi:hypothetical protein
MDSSAQTPAKMTLDEYYKAWDAHVKSMTEASAAVDWSGHDFSKLKAKDIGVSLGPALTEEQFEQYRQGRSDVQVLKAPSPSASRK